MTGPPGPVPLLARPAAAALTFAPPPACFPLSSPPCGSVAVPGSLGARSLPWTVAGGLRHAHGALDPRPRSGLRRARGGAGCAGWRVPVARFLARGSAVTFASVAGLGQTPSVFDFPSRVSCLRFFGVQRTFPLQSGAVMKVGVGSCYLGSGRPGTGVEVSGRPWGDSCRLPCCRAGPSLRGSAGPRVGLAPPRRS